MIWQYLLPFIVLAQTATPTATLAPTPSFTPTPTPLPLTINNLPSQITSGQQFNLTLNLRAKLNLSYQFKVYGGVNGDNYSYEVENNGNWINGYNGAWDSLPQASTDSSGNASFGLTVRFRTDKNSGTSSLVAKVKETLANTYITSSNYNLDVIDPSPTPMPTSTSTPTSTPTAVPTPTDLPTNTPTIIPTSSIIPTVTSFSTVTPPPEDTPANSPADQTFSSVTDVLGTSTSAPVSTESSSLSNFLPLIFIIVGGILLATPLIISQIKIKWPAKK